MPAGRDSSVNLLPPSNSIAAGNDEHDLGTTTPTFSLQIAPSPSRSGPMEANALSDNFSSSSACDLWPGARKTPPLPEVTLVPSSNHVLVLESPSIQDDSLQSLPSGSISMSFSALFDFIAADALQSSTSETTSLPDNLSVPGYDALPCVSKSIMLHLIVCSPSVWSRICTVESVCKWLAIVLEEDLEKIITSVKELCKQSILTITYHTFKDPEFDFQKLFSYLPFAFEELSKHPIEETWIAYSIHDSRSSTLNHFVASMDQEFITELILENCENLQVVDVRGLPNLCFLWLEKNQKLKKILGWENLRKLRWLHWNNNKSFKHDLHKSCEFPDFKYLTALQRLDLAKPKNNMDFYLSACTLIQEIHLLGEVARDPVIIPDLTNLEHLLVLHRHLCDATKTISSISQRTSLISLQVNFCDIGEEIDLSSLVNLTYFNCCDTEVKKLSGIENLNNLRRLLCTHSELSHLPDLRGLTLLVALTLAYCKDLKAIPGLGYLVNLKCLDVRGTSLKDIFGVEKLKKLETLRCTGCSSLNILPGPSGYETEYSGLTNLVSLTLAYCQNLKALPNLGYLTNLMYLNLCGTSITYVPGLENLSNLRELDCSMSDLSFLPDLANLFRLRGLNVDDTPLQRDGRFVQYNTLQVSSECTTLSRPESDEDEVWDYEW